MLNRREFTIGAAGAVSLSATGLNALAAESPTQKALIIDAMGEIREVYTDSLCREMIESGLNSVTVTLCDPKSYEAEAYAWAMDGVLEYDRLIEKESEFWMKATSVADIQKARDTGRIAPVRHCLNRGRQTLYSCHKPGKCVQSFVSLIGQKTQSLFAAHTVRIWGNIKKPVPVRGQNFLIKHEGFLDLSVLGNTVAGNQTTVFRYSF